MEGEIYYGFRGTNKRAGGVMIKKLLKGDLNNIAQVPITATEGNITPTI